jgi:hypothetical protein
MTAIRRLDLATAVQMARPFTAPPASTFIVRFWCEGGAGGSQWRCQIRHVQSGESAYCLDLESVLGFIQYLGVMTDKQALPSEKQAPPE